MTNTNTNTNARAVAIAARMEKKAAKKAKHAAERAAIADYKRREDAYYNAVAAWETNMILNHCGYYWDKPSRADFGIDE